MEISPEEKQGVDVIPLEKFFNKPTMFGRTNVFQQMNTSNQEKKIIGTPFTNVFGNSIEQQKRSSESPFPNLFGNANSFFPEKKPTESAFMFGKPNVFQQEKPQPVVQKPVQNLIPGGEQTKPEISISQIEQQTTLSPRHPEFLSYNERLKTFRDWPLQMTQTGQEMAKAGYVYNNQNDSTTCFWCGNSVFKWLPYEHPVGEHKRLYGVCTFLVMNYNV